MWDARAIEDPKPTRVRRCAGLEESTCRGTALPLNRPIYSVLRRLPRCLGASGKESEGVSAIVGDMNTLVIQDDDRVGECGHV